MTHRLILEWDRDDHPWEVRSLCSCGWEGAWRRTGEFVADEGHDFDDPSKRGESNEAD